MTIEERPAPEVTWRSRFAPPNRHRRSMVRDRLSTAMADRWQHQVTVVTAGAGFGKTTLLTQMFQQNVVAPVGIDLWLSCRSSDATWSGLAASLTGVLGTEDLVADDPAGNADRLHAGFAQLSPDQVCLVIDDVHLVTAGSPAAELLALLVDNLPPNGHLVLAGRTAPAVPLARLVAHGAVRVVDEASMAFTGAELDDFAALRGVPVDTVQGSAGWAALAELRATLGTATAGQFLWDEVLGRMAPDVLATLAVVSALGSADAALLEVAARDVPALGVVDVADLDGIPLIEFQGGSCRPHALWSEPLHGVLSAATLGQVRRQAAQELARRGRFDEALPLTIAARAIDDTLTILRQACDPSNRPTPLDVLSGWLRLLPASIDDHPAVLLVRGVAAKSQDHDPDRALALLERAAEAFRAIPDADGELAALVHLLHLTFWMGDRELQGSTVRRILALGQVGSTTATSLASLARAYLLLGVGDGPGTVKELGNIEAGALDDSWMALADLVRAAVLTTEGRTDEALRLVDHAAGRVGTEFARFGDQVRSTALWLAGRFEEYVAFSEEAIRSSEQLGRTEHLHTTLASYACGFAYLGDDRRAAALADRLGSLPSRYRTLDASTTLAAAASLVSTGDEGAAARLLADDAAASPIAADSNWFRRINGLALSYVLVPETRAAWEGSPLPPSARLTCEVAAALVAVREQADLVPAGRHDWSTGTGILAHLPLPWAIELAVAAVAAGDLTAGTWLEQLDSTGYRHLRQLATSSTAVGRAAKRLTSQVAPPPVTVTTIRVLGGLRVERDGVQVVGPDWNRARVRQLLLFLATSGEITREDAIRALWPDLDVEPAQNNFRVTLSYLQRLLEPGRGRNEPSYLLHQTANVLRLNTGTHLRLDTELFAAAVRGAAEALRHGHLREALTLHQEALDLYRGDLGGAEPPDWAVGAQTRLRSQFLAVALRAGELLLAEGDTDEPLVLAGRVLDVEPWSERAHRLQASAHLARGERAAARRTLDLCLARLDDLDVAPEPETTRLDRLTRLITAAEPVVGAP